MVVDRDEQAFLRLGDDWRGRIVQGHAFDRTVLEEAGIADADALLAVTSGDNTNTLVAQVATARYRVPSVAARILDPGRADFYQNRGFEIVSPAKDAIETLSRWTTSAASPV